MPHVLLGCLFAGESERCVAGDTGLVGTGSVIGVVGTDAHCCHVNEGIHHLIS